jgi:DNA-3-methyladenine glycosylase II
MDDTFTYKLKAGATHLAAHDPIMAELIANHPAPTFRPHTDYYRELVDSIISQQLSVKAAATIYKRFVDSFGHVPEPHEILARDDADLRTVGLSGKKTRYIKDLAQHVIDGTVDFSNLDEGTNDEIVAELTKVKGVGEWTVHMFLLFCMGRLDVLPVGDLGIKNAIAKLYDINSPTPADISRIAEVNQWHPYESIATWYLWKSLDVVPLSTADSNAKSV